MKWRPTLKIDKCKRAFERRYGKSMMPLNAYITNEETCHVKDLETGSWAVYDVRFIRIRRLREFDATA